MAEKCDVFIHSMRPDSAKRLGVGYDALRQRNPRIIYASAPGYRSDGPKHNDPAYDDVIQGESGIAGINMLAYGEPRYFPTRVTPNDVWSIFNCCGDFQLAHKNLWFKIRGYEEPMMYSCYPDTNIQKKAILYGFKLEPIYDIPLYHMSHKGMGNDGSSPSKQYYNNPWEWVENFNRYEHPLNKHIGGTYMVSRNADTWGFSNVEIEFEVI